MRILMLAIFAVAIDTDAHLPLLHSVSIKASILIASTIPASMTRSLLCLSGLPCKLWWL